jgi:ribosomal-protein-alanine N-acetyltransferase
LKRITMKILPKFIELESKDLRLVALDLAQAPAVFAYASDEEVTKFVAWPRHENIEVTRNFLVWSMTRYASGGHYDWGLVRKSDEQLIGTCGFSNVDFERGVGEIGYVLGKPYWGHGYVTQAARVVLDFGFRQLGLRRVEAQAYPENGRSLAVMARLGMRYVETRTYSDETSGRAKAVSVWAMNAPQTATC